MVHGLRVMFLLSLILCSGIALGQEVCTEQQKLLASDAAAGDQLGWTVGISGDTAIVGTRYDDDAGSNSGSAYVFQRNEGGADNWGEVKKLTASDAAASGRPGSSSRQRAPSTPSSPSS